jgi:hypothetical protein
MSSINTSGEIIQGAAALCNGIIDMLSASISNMQSKYRNAGNDWNDSKYQQLGDIVNECSTAIKKPLQELDRCRMALNEIERAVVEYESVNFDGQSPLISDNNAPASTVRQGYGYNSLNTGETEIRSSLMQRFISVLTALVSALMPPTITLSENEARIYNDIPIVRRIREIREGEGHEWPWIEGVEIRPLREDESNTSLD